MKITKFLLITFLYQLPVFAFELIVNTPFLTPSSDQIYLTGDIPGHCQWEPNCIKFSKIGAQNYRIKLDALKPGTEFKITRGHWATEASSSANHIYSNFLIPAKKNQMVIDIPNWKDLALWGKSENIFTYENFYSPELNNYRTIYIWVPKNYHTSTDSFPVIYMHDGQNIFNPKTSSFGNEWGVDEILETLVKNGEVRPAIIVGISSTKDRNAEYTYLNSGRNYAKFLIETVRPFVNKNFRTLIDRKHTYTIGSSMGALISFTLLWNHADIFSKGAGLSLPVFAHDFEIYNFLRKYPKAPKNTFFYMDHGGQGQDAEYLKSAEQFFKDLTETYSLPKNNIIYRTFPWANHTEIDWARRVDIPLKYLLN